MTVKAKISSKTINLTDPKPAQPLRPSSDDCCRSGCSPCVFELYQDDLQRYREQLAAWQIRHPEGKSV
ncbi:MAG: oxidoreductase-like domain-containing protein [Herbaspirillum sp.]